MLLDAQKKLALQDAEIERIGESNSAQIASLQARLEEQSEDFKKELEMERYFCTGSRYQNISILM